LTTKDKRSVEGSGGNSLKENIHRYMKESFLAAHIAVTSVEQKCNTVRPFPQHIFTHDFSQPQHTSSRTLTSNTSASLLRGNRVDDISVLTSLESTECTEGHVGALRDMVKGADLRTLPMLTAAGLEREEFSEMQEYMESLCDCYSTEGRDMD